MSTVQEPKTREEIQRDFNQLLRRHEAQASQISTKAEEAEQAKYRELVDQAAAYTVESIVNDLAKLQLGFGRSVDEIATTLDEESSKLGQMRRAIEVERARLERLQGTVVAAEALAILEQDRRQAQLKLEEEMTEARETLADEIEQQREIWTEEEAEQARAVQDYTDQLTKDRTLSEEEYAYEQERLARVEADEQAVQRREVERELSEQEALKAKDWAAREKVLDADQSKIDELRTKVEGFSDALDKAARDAREKSIAKVNREAKFELEMLDKQQASDVKVFELKVQTLEERIARQTALIKELSTKLDATIAKSQGLAEQAFHRPKLGATA